MSLTEKREGVSPEKRVKSTNRIRPPAKFVGKRDDDGSEDEASRYDYCMICHGHVGHECFDCPNKAKGMGLYCFACYGPCKKKDDVDYDPLEHKFVERYKQCAICMRTGEHWADECPARSDLENEIDDVSDDSDDSGF